MFNHVLVLDMILKARAGGRVEIFTFFFLAFQLLNWPFENSE